MSLPFINDDGDSDPTTQGDAFDTLQIDATLAERLTPHGPNGEREAVRVRPFKEHGGIETAVEFLEATHELQTKGGRLRSTRNVSPAHTFEIRYTGNRVNFQFVPADGWTNFVERQVKDKYPESQVERTPANLAAFDEGKHVAAADLELDRYTLYPIKHLDLEGFTRDPFGSITSEMTGTQIDGRPDADVVVQIVFKPAVRSWTDGVDGGPSITSVERRILQTEYEWDGRWLPINRVPIEPGPKEKEAAKIVREQSGEKAWHVNLRVFAVSEDADIAASRVEKAAGMFRNYYESRTEQRFIPRPLAGRELREGVENAAARRFVENGIVKSQSEVAGLVHIPNDTINQQNVEWALSRPGEGVPPGTPRVDFDELGVAMADETEKQVAMIESGERGDPFMFGLGTRNGIEAGVTEDTLDTHAFIGGRSGAGKTSHGKNLFRQVTKRDYGCLVYDPKGMDAEDFAALVPDGREDDLIFLELGSNRDHQVGFNFLEAPGTAEPGTAEHSAALEAMADDLEAILPLASGDGENSWGTRMSRIARNIARGLGKLDREVTLYDAHIIANEAAGREAYAGALDAEDVNFIKDYAINHLAEMDDDEIEPFAGRLQQLIENETVREIVTIKDGFSIDEAVEEGKIIIVQDNDKSDTTGKMVATALIRRIWVSIREQTFDDDRPDPEKFYAILDEFDEIATVNSDVANIFSDARSFGLSLIPMTQDLSSEKIDKKVREMIEGQAETFISYDPGREGEARMVESQHSKDIEYNDLLDLSKHRFMMRTHDENGELTHSYKVQATPPIDELAPEIARSPEERDALIDRRVREVGSERRTDEEIMNSSTIYDESETDETDTSRGVERAAALQAIYDEGYYADDPAGFVTLDEASERLTRYLERVDVDAERPSVIEGVIGPLPEQLLERDHGDDLRVRCTDEGKMRFLSPVDEDDQEEGTVSENTGGFEHAEIMRAAYDEFLEAGLPLRVLHQAGDNAPDAKAIPDAPELTRALNDETLELADRAELLEQFRQKYPRLNERSDARPVDVEAEHTTGDTSPGTTLEHIARSLEDGRRVILLAWPDTAERIAGRLDDDPKCMYPFSGADGAARCYNGNHPLRVGPDEKHVWRRGDGDNVWLQHSDGSVELRTEGGETVATFDDPEDVRTDVDAYPKTDDEISSVEGWCKIYRPVLPTVAFGEGGLDRERVDVIEVSEDGLRLVEDGGETKVPFVGDAADDDRDALQEESDDSESDDAGGFSL